MSIVKKSIQPIYLQGWWYLSSSFCLFDGDFVVIAACQIVKKSAKLLKVGNAAAAAAGGEEICQIFGRCYHFCHFCFCRFCHRDEMEKSLEIN